MGEGRTGRTVFVRGLERACRIGVGEEERATPQTVRISVELEVEESVPADDEALSSVVDYDPLIRLIEDATNRPVRLVETLAGRLADGCFYDPRIRAARVTVEKTDLLPGAATAGVEIARISSRAR